MSDKYSNGIFCFYRVSAAYLPMTPHTIELIASKWAVPASIVPTYAGDRATVSRAIGATAAAARKAGWVLTSIKASAHEVVYGISAVHKDQTQERVDHTFDDRLRWNDETMASQIVGQHEIALQVNVAYQDLRGKITAGDWTEALTTYLIKECSATAVRDDGRVYWCVPSALPKLKALGTFLQDIGLSLVLCEVESESRVVVQQAAQEGIADQLQKLQEEADTFDAKQMPSTYKARIETYHALRKRATLYRDTLGIGIEQACSILDTLETKIHGLLGTRESTVLHRNGTVGIKTSNDPMAYVNALLAQGEDAITQALTDGTLDVQLPPALPSQW